MKSWSLWGTAFALSLIIVGACAQTASTPTNSKSKKMKQFSLLVRVPDTYGSEEAKLVGPQWDKQIETWKADGVYVLSFAFPGRSFTVSGKQKIIKEQTILSEGLKVVSNIVVTAETIEQALELAKDCPILIYDGSVEVREIPKPVTPVK